MSGKIFSGTLSLGNRLGISGRAKDTYQKFHRSITLVNTWISATVPPKILESETVLPLEELPTLSVVAPLYKEANVVKQLYGAMTSLNYPEEKVELIWVLEKEDEETINAIRNTFETIEMEAGLPIEIGGRIKVFYNLKRRMKANSLNLALEKITGEYMVIYDADVIPEEDQALKAMAVFKENPETSLLQAFIYPYNKDENGITKLHGWEFSRDWDYCTRLVNFTDGYFNLKGHSFFVKTEDARAIGGWNQIVTEDIDFGINFVIHGFKMGIFNSVTYEEAPSTLKQVYIARNRWCAGYIHSGIANAKGIITAGMGLKKLATIIDVSFLRPLDKLLSPILWVYIAYLFTQKSPIALPLLAAYLILAFLPSIALNSRVLKSLRSALLVKLWDCFTCLFVWTGLFTAITRPHEFDTTDHKGKQNVLGELN